MKTVSLILRALAGALVAIAALAFTVVEGTLLVTLDFALYENGFLGFVQLALKLFIALSAGTLGILSLVKIKSPFLWEGICLLVTSAVMLPLISNGIGVYIAAAAAFFALVQLLSFMVYRPKSAKASLHISEKEDG